MMHIYIYIYTYIHIFVVVILYCVFCHQTGRAGKSCISIDESAVFSSIELSVYKGFHGARFVVPMYRYLMMELGPHTHTCG